LEDDARGAAVFCDSRGAWDQPDGGTLRLTAVYTPKGQFLKSARQDQMDFGINTFSCAVYPFTIGETDVALRAEEFRHPLVAYETSKHTGFSSSLSLFDLPDERIIVRAVKKAEDSDGMVIRINNISNETVLPVLPFNSGLQMSALEEPVENRQEAIEPAGIRTILFPEFPKKLEASALRKAEQLAIPYNCRVTSINGEMKNGIIPHGISLPSELFPEEIISGTDKFILRQENDNCVQCTEQTIELPNETKSVSLLLAAADNRREAAFSAGTVCVAGIFEPNGSGDHYTPDIKAFETPDTPGYVFTHCHNEEGKDLIAKTACFYKYMLDIPSGDTVLKLPDDPDILLLALTANFDDHFCKPLKSGISKSSAEVSSAEPFPEVKLKGLSPFDSWRGLHSFLWGFYKRKAKRTAKMISKKI